jgi:Protein  of unknown function (DUF3018)
MPDKPRRARPSAKTPARKTFRGGSSGVKRSHAKSSHNAPTRTKSSRDKVRAYRQRMRKRGMKLIQIWVPDPKSPYFAAEARRQARLLAQSPHEKEDQAFIDSLSEWKPG